MRMGKNSSHCAIRHRRAKAYYHSVKPNDTFIQTVQKMFWEKRCCFQLRKAPDNINSDTRISTDVASKFLTLYK